MLRMRELRAHAEASPSFARVSRDFNARETFNGVTIFAPVLGNHNVSVLRELSDYSRSLALCEEHERARGRQYERLVFSRLEFVWLAPHPPLALMPARESLPPHRPIVWVPSGQNIVGVNDRHAVVPRASADVYFRRWELLHSPNLEALVPLAALRHGGPEDFLDGVLVASKVAIGLFPATALLACCRGVGRCFASDCSAMPRVGSARAPPWATVPPGGAGAVEGKYPTEVRDAVYHWRFLQCAGAAPELRPELLSKRWAFDPGGAQRPHRVLVSVPAGRRTLGLDALTPLVRLDRTRDAPAPSGRGCPLDRAADAAPPLSAPHHGLCEPTPFHNPSDCARGMTGTVERDARRVGGGVFAREVCRQVRRLRARLRLVLGDPSRLLLVLALPQPGARDDAPPPRHPRPARADRPPRPRRPPPPPRLFRVGLPDRARAADRRGGGGGAAGAAEAAAARRRPRPAAALSSGAPLAPPPRRRRRSPSRRQSGGAGCSSAAT